MKGTLYKKIDIEGLFDNGKTSDTNEIIVELSEKNNILRKEVKVIKREWETQSIRLCEVIQEKKKIEEDKIMAEEDKRRMGTTLEEISFEVQKITKN